MHTSTIYGYDKNKIKQLWLTGRTNPLSKWKQRNLTEKKYEIDKNNENCKPFSTNGVEGHDNQQVVVSGSRRKLDCLG